MSITKERMKRYKTMRKVEKDIAMAEVLKPETKEATRTVQQYISELEATLRRMESDSKAKK